MKHRLGAQGNFVKRVVKKTSHTWADSAPQRGRRISEWEKGAAEAAGAAWGFRRNFGVEVSDRGRGGIEITTYFFNWGSIV